MFSNGTGVKMVNQLNSGGYLWQALWVRPSADAHYARGEAMFRGQCGSCHTLHGYRALDQLLAGRNRESVGNLLGMLHDYKPDSPYRRFMPPLAGTADEVRDLGDYLYSMIAPPSQQGGKALAAKR